MAPYQLGDWEQQRYAMKCKVHCNYYIYIRSKIRVEFLTPSHIFGYWLLEFQYKAMNLLMDLHLYVLYLSLRSRYLIALFTKSGWIACFIITSKCSLVLSAKPCHVFNLHCWLFFFIQFGPLATSECISVLSVEPWSVIICIQFAQLTTSECSVVVSAAAELQEQWLARVGRSWWDKATSLLSSMQECVAAPCMNVVRCDARM